MLFFAVLMHRDRNFFLALPCRPLASASREHARDEALRAFLIAAHLDGNFLAAGAVTSEGWGEGVVWANAPPSQAKLTIAAKTKTCLRMGLPLALQVTG